MFEQAARDGRIGRNELPPADGHDHRWRRGMRAAYAVRVPL
jgi:hypothetical protein